MSIAVQSAVGPIGGKATTELTLSFAALVTGGRYHYGLNENGIHLLNSGDVDGEDDILRSISFATSDYGSKNLKRFRFIYLQVEVLGDASFTVAVRPDKGAWISKTVSTTGAGTKTLKVPIQREGGQGNYLSVKITSFNWFKLHAVNGLINIRTFA